MVLHLAQMLIPGIVAVGILFPGGELKDHVVEVVGKLILQGGNANLSIIRSMRKPGWLRP